MRGAFVLLAGFVVVLACGPSEAVKFAQETLRSENEGERLKASILAREQAQKRDRGVSLLLPDLLRVVARDTRQYEFDGRMTSGSEEARKAILAITPRPIPELLALLEAEDARAHEKIGAIMVLGEMKASEAVDPLLSYLETEAIFMGDDEILVALGEIGDPRTVTPLLAYMSRGNIECRAAGRSIGSIGSDAAVQALQSAAADRGFPCRLGAIDGLHEAAAPGSVPTLGRILNDATDDPEIRVHAALILGHIRDPRSVEALIQALDGCPQLCQPNGAIPNQVTWALSELTGEKLGDQRSTWEAWWAGAESSFESGRRVAGSGT